MQIIIWSKYHCPNCDQAKILLQQKGYDFEERKIGDGWTLQELLETIPGVKSVPQIQIDGEHIGGLMELRSFLNEH